MRLLACVLVLSACGSGAGSSVDAPGPSSTLRVTLRGHGLLWIAAPSTRITCESATCTRDIPIGDSWFAGGLDLAAYTDVTKDQWLVSALLVDGQPYGDPGSDTLRTTLTSPGDRVVDATFIPLEPCTPTAAPPDPPTIDGCFFGEAAAPTTEICAFGSASGSTVLVGGRGLGNAQGASGDPSGACVWIGTTRVNTILAGVSAANDIETFAITAPSSVGLGPNVVTDLTLTGAGSKPLSIVQLPAPEITSLSPTTAPTSGGVTITISGTNLDHALYVNIFGSRALTFALVTSRSPTSAQFTIPPRLPADTYAIGVVNACASSATTVPLTLN